MTIASCFLLPEGAILSADSTTTYIEPSDPTQPPIVRYFQHGQKIFEVGEEGTLALVTWGCGDLGDKSYRTIIAEFADLIDQGKVSDMAGAVEQWRQLFWQAYQAAFAPQIQAARQLTMVPPVDARLRKVLEAIVTTLTVGFCIAGRYGSDRTPSASVFIFAPTQTGPPNPQPVKMGDLLFWGWPALVNRMALGFDPDILGMIIGSGKWSGTPQELFQVMSQKALKLPRIMPLRDAIELSYSMIDATIKTMKFSHLPHTCGGPIEIALRRTDRPFKWVTHKSFTAALDLTKGNIDGIQR
jgi:hypothetical protein